MLDKSSEAVRTCEACSSASKKKTFFWNCTCNFVYMFFNFFNRMGLVLIVISWFLLRKTGLVGGIVYLLASQDECSSSDIETEVVGMNSADNLFCGPLHPM